jgi:hypothetical protein
MHRVFANSLLLLLSCWLVVATVGEPAAVYQWAVQLSGMELDQPGNSAPDDDDADELIVAPATARRPNRRPLLPGTGLGVHRYADFIKLFTAPVLPAPALLTAAPNFHRGAGAYLRC